MKRIFFNLAFLFSILFLPWWFAVLTACVAIFFIDRMYELLVWGALFDVVFGPHIDSAPIRGLIVSVIFCLLSFFVNKAFLMPTRASRRI